MRPGPDPRVPAIDSADNERMSQALGGKDDTVAGTSVVALAKQIIVASVVVDALLDVPGVDALNNTYLRDVVGNKADTVGGTSLVALVKQLAATLAGTDSEVAIVEEHLHTEQLCFGNTAGVLADGSLAPFQLTTDSVADSFGAETQIYAGAIGAGVYIDLDKVVVVDIQRTSTTYLIEFWAGSGVFGAATRVASMYFRSATATFRSGETLVRSPRVRGDLNIWARVKSSYNDTSTIDILFMPHKYPSDSGDEVDS